MKQEEKKIIDRTVAAVKLCLLNGDYRGYMEALTDEDRKAVNENLEKVISAYDTKRENFAKETVFFMGMARDYEVALQDAQKCLPLSQAMKVQAILDKYKGDTNEQDS